MLEIVDVSNSNINEAKNFLLGVPSITDVDMIVLNRAVLLLKDEGIEGVISYEEFHNYGLVRYFVFRKSADSMAIKELFLALEKKIITNNIYHLFSLVNSSEIEELFTDLGFVEIDKEMIFLDEDMLANTKFKDAKMMMKLLAA